MHMTGSSAMLNASMRHSQKYTQPARAPMATTGDATLALSRSSSSRDPKRAVSGSSAALTSQGGSTSATTATIKPQIQCSSHNPHHLAVYTLFAVCAMFIVTLIPNAVLSMTLYIETMFRGQSRLFCLLKALDAPFQIVRLINYSFNFVLYGLTGRRFRRELQLLCMHSRLLRTICPQYLNVGLKETILLRELRPTPDRT